MASNRNDADYMHEALAVAERRHFWFISRAKLLGWAVRRYFPRMRSFVDVGCGTGGTTVALQKEFPHAAVVGGDPDPGGLVFAQRHVPRLRLIQIDICQLPFGATFDVAGAFDVLEHLDDDGAALAAMRDAVKPGGGLVITVPQHPSLWSESDDFSHHRRRYTRHELRTKLEAAGLRVVLMTSFASIVLPLIAVSRWRPKRKYVPEAELRIGDVPNRILLALSAIERWMIAAGVSLPAGGSLLAVAERPA